MIINEEPALLIMNVCRAEPLFGVINIHVLLKNNVQDLVYFLNPSQNQCIRA